MSKTQDEAFECSACYNYQIVGSIDDSTGDECARCVNGDEYISKYPSKREVLLQEIFKQVALKQSFNTQMRDAELYRYTIQIAITKTLAFAEASYNHTEIEAIESGRHEIIEELVEFLEDCIDDEMANDGYGDGWRSATVLFLSTVKEYPYGKSNQSQKIAQTKVDERHHVIGLIDEMIMRLKRSRDRQRDSHSKVSYNHQIRILIELKQKLEME